MADQEQLFEVPRGKPKAASQENALRDSIEEMVGALCDPLIVFPSGWEDTLPEELKKRLPLDRLVHQMKCLHGQARWDEACDLEALLYMYPLTLAQPISEQWTRIYLYLGTKVMGDRIPQDIKEETLSDYDMVELRQLKRWIQKQKLKARKERKKEPRQRQQDQQRLLW